MSASKIVQSLVAPPLGAALKAHGFTRKGLVFRRSVGDSKQVLQVQCGTGSNGSAELVFNLGVLHPAVDRVLKRPRVKEPSEYECTFRTRIGPRARGDSWWSIKAGDTAPPPGLMARVEKGVLPWFEMATDVASLTKALEAGEVWSDDLLAPFGVAMALGQHELAAASLQRAVDDIQKKRKQRAAQFAKDPFGIDVLKRAKKLAAEHGLTLAPDV